MTALEQSTHGAGCPCPRCAGFGVGNPYGTKHGAYVGLRADLVKAAERLGVEAVEEADLIRSLVPGYSESDELAVLDLAVTRVRIRRAQSALQLLDERTADGGELNLYASERAGSFEALRADLYRWLRHSRALMNDLGLTTMSRAELGLTVARAIDLARLSDAQLTALEQALVAGGVADA